MALKANYEAVMVVSMKQGEDGIQAIIEKFKSLIENNATLQSVDEWGKRKLAYLINKEAEGYYVLYNFECEADFPAELDRIFRITDGVIRSLIIRKPEGAEIAVAKEEPEEVAAEEEAPAEEAPAEEAPAEEAPAEEAPAEKEAPAEEAPAEEAAEAAEEAAE